jgi:NarL family two-component system response regulator LiaR
MTKSPTTVLIVEDHGVVAEGVSHILTRFGMEVVGTCNNWELAVTRFASLHPDVVLLDLNVPPDGNGLNLLPLIRHQDPHACVVCLSAASSASEVAAAIEAGVSGFISKLADPEEIPPLLELALSGEIAVDKRTAAKLITSNHRKTQSAEAMKLNERETEVIELIAKGFSNQQIAKRLHVSRTSVSDALTRAYRKLGAKDRVSATLIAVKLGLVVEDDHEPTLLP